MKIDINELVNITDGEQQRSMEVPDSGMSLVLIAGGFTLVDNADLPEVLKYQWFADRDGYATTFIKEPTFKSLRMHNLILPREYNTVTDHRNHIRLDNRRSNLQLLTIAEHNRKRQPDSNDIVYKQEELLQRGTNYSSFKTYKSDLAGFLSEVSKG